MIEFTINRIKNDVRTCIAEWRNDIGIICYATEHQPVGTCLFTKRYLLIAIAWVLCPCKARYKEEENGKELFHVFVF